MMQKLALIKHTEKGQCDLCHQDDREVWVWDDDSSIGMYCHECCCTGELE